MENIIEEKNEEAELPSSLPDVQVLVSDNYENTNFILENASYDTVLREAIFTIEEYFNLVKKPLRLEKKLIDKPTENVSFLVSSIDFENLKAICVRESDGKAGEVALSLADLGKFSYEIKSNLMKNRGTLTPQNKVVLDKSLEVFKQKTSVPVTTGGTKKYKKDVLRDYIVENPKGDYKDAEDNLCQQFSGEKIIQFPSFMYEARRNFVKEGKDLVLDTVNKKYELKVKEFEDSPKPDDSTSQN